MEIWMWLAGGIFVGFISSYGLSAIAKRKKTVGTLRMDCSDPDEAPYLFLELEQDGMSKIHKNKTVCLKVDLNGYLTRK